MRRYIVVRVPLGAAVTACCTISIPSCAARPRSARTPDALAQLANDPDLRVRFVVADRAPREIAAKLVDDEDLEVRAPGARPHGRIQGLNDKRAAAGQSGERFLKRWRTLL